MTNFTINSREFGKISFFMPSDGGHVFLESKGKPGTLGQQICRGGRCSGSTIRATPETFEAICRAWHRKHMAACREYGLEYGN